MRPKDYVDLANLLVLVVTFIAAGVAAYEAKRLADGTDQLIADGQRMAALSRETLIATQRPWIAASFNVGNLTYSDGAVSLPISVILRNTGRSPALNVYVLAKADTDIGTDEAFRRQAKLCEETRGFDRRGGNLLFPKDEVVQPRNLELTKEAVAASSQRAGYYDFSIYGCADYVSTLDRPHHQTGFIVSASPSHPVGPKNIFQFYVKAGDVAAADIIGGRYRAD